MNRIRILSEKVISMIAAGEVIERPASVVKELIDNSIDAGANSITVEIKRGGIRYIKASDNGSGMSKDDLLLSVERHATSKISAEDDLHLINTMGFRGEALPSIGAVSRLAITSRLRDELSAHRLIMEGGVLKSIGETGSPPGTIVEVKDLFYNVPARRKFLKSINTETFHIMDTFSRIAIPFHEVRFNLLSNGKVMMNLPASHRLQDRLSMIVGRNTADSMEEFETQGNGFSIKGYTASPDFTRSRPDRIYLYVNRRSIKDRMITRAIIEGYGQRLMKGAYPQAIILIDILPELVDVNVHPSKLEVRFKNPRMIYESLINGIMDIWKKRWTVTPVFEHGEVSEFQQQIPLHVKEPPALYSEKREDIQDIWFESEPRAHKKAGFSQDNIRIIGQINNRYIVCEADDGMLLIDQHAAHERVIYEKLRNSRPGEIRVQSLLIPFQLELSVMDANILEDNLDILKELGIDIEQFGQSSFIVRALPQQISGCDINSLFNEIIPILKEGARLRKEEIMDGITKLMACHSSIRSGADMSKEEMKALIHQLRKTEVPSNCPHGRPTYKRFSFSELDRLFKRQL